MDFEKNKEFVSEHNRRIKEQEINESLMDIYCDKRFFWSGNICGGELYNINGPGRSVKGYNSMYEVGKCTKCGKTHFIDR